MNNTNEWVQFVSGQKAMKIKDLIEYKTLCDFMKDVRLQNNIEMNEINEMLNKSEIVYAFLDKNQDLKIEEDTEKDSITIEGLRLYFDNTANLRDGHYNSFIDRVIWNTFEQDICKNVVNYSMLDKMSEKKTLKEKEQYCIQYVYSEVSEERTHKERYSEESGLYKKSINKKELKLFADYVLYHWRNAKSMKYRKIETWNGYVHIYDTVGNDVELVIEKNQKIYQKYFNQVIADKYPYEKHPKLYHKYTQGNIEYVDFLIYKLKEQDLEEYKYYDKKVLDLVHDDKTYVKLKPFDIVDFLNEEFELMPNYIGKE